MGWDIPGATNDFADVSICTRKRRVFLQGASHRSSRAVVVSHRLPSFLGPILAGEPLYDVVPAPPRLALISVAVAFGVRASLALRVGMDQWSLSEEISMVIGDVLPP